MTVSVSTIKRLLNGRLVASELHQLQVCRSLLFLPEEVLTDVCARVWFISSSDDSWALTFRGSELRNRHLIFLSDELFRQSESDIIFTILHEVGHVLLNHRNSIGRQQTKAEIRKQEKEANQFAESILSGGKSKSVV